MRDVRELWPWVALAIIIAGIVARSGIVTMLGFGVPLACGGAALWARWSLRRVEHERLLPEDRAFAGESVPLTLRITNRKPLPLTRLEVDEQFPEAMLAGSKDELAQVGQVGSVSLRWKTSAGGYERISRSMDLRRPERGIWEIGPTHIRSGDPFGLFEEEHVETRRTRVVVYPQVICSTTWGCQRAGRTATARRGSPYSRTRRALRGSATIGPATACGASTGARRHGWGRCSRGCTSRRRRATCCCA